MLNKKLAGLLLVPAMLASVGASHAISSSATQVLQCTLGTYLDITPITSGAVTTTSIAPDTGALAAALVSKFQINLNASGQPLYLQGKTASSTNPNENALFQQGGSTYVVFSNTAATKLPTTAAVADCKAASPVSANNSNAIVYPISSVALDNGGTATYNVTKNQYDVTANAGATIATTTTGTAARPNTYSYADNAGTYQAIMTLTSTSL